MVACCIPQPEGGVFDPQGRPSYIHYSVSCEHGDEKDNSASASFVLTALWHCSVADLLRVNGTAAVLKGGQNYAYVRTTGDPALQLLQPNIVQSPTYDIGIPSPQNRTEQYM